MAILSPVSLQDKQTEGKHLWCISHMLCAKWSKMVVKTWKQQWFREGRNRLVKARAWFSLASHSSPSTQHCGQLALTSLFLHSRMKENPVLVTQVLWNHTESKKLHEQKALLGNVCPSVLQASYQLRVLYEDFSGTLQPVGFPSSEMLQSTLKHQLFFFLI